MRIIGHYQGVPIGYRVVEKTETTLVLDVFPILPGPDGGESLPQAA